MHDNEYARQFRFQYNYMVMGRVTAAYTLVNERKLYVDVTALDSRASWQQVPVGTTAGVTRNFRVGQIVGLLFRYSSATLPLVIANLHNLEVDPRYTDPLPPPMQHIDDQVYYHPETGAFMRLRSATSTPTQGGGDGQPAIAEITLASGASLVIEETDSSHARALLTLPSGASIAIAVDGTITATSPTKAVVHAPDVELGGDTGKALASAIARNADLANIIAQHNVHTHEGVLSGPATSGPPTVPATTPPCSGTAFSQ